MISFDNKKNSTHLLQSIVSNLVLDVPLSVCVCLQRKGNDDLQTHMTDVSHVCARTSTDMKSIDSMHIDGIITLKEDEPQKVPVTRSDIQTCSCSLGMYHPLMYTS